MQSIRFSIKNRARQRSHFRFFQSAANALAVDATLKLIEQKRLSDPVSELARLKQNHFVKERLTNINRHYKSSRYQSYEPSLLHQMAYARSLEIVENVKDSHYVFHHGQAGSSFLVLNSLSKLLYQAGMKKAFLQFETVLRHPFVFKHMDPLTHTVDWYSKQITWENIRRFSEETSSDHAHANVLVSADACLVSTDLGESALYYFQSGAIRKNQWIQQAIHAMDDNYFLDPSYRQPFLRAFEKLSSEVASQGHGALYSICIPKKDFSRYGYISEPFGVCANLDYPKIHSLLTKLQNETMPIEEYRSHAGIAFYQVRLLAHQFDLETVKVFIFPAMRDDQYEKLMKKTQTLMRFFRVGENQPEARRALIP